MDLAGKSCKAMVAREFWLRDRLVTELCYVFLMLNDGQCFGIYLDDESISWKIRADDEVPAPGTVIGDKEFRYPHTDLAAKFPITGKELKAFEIAGQQTCSRGILSFMDGSALVFAYDYATEVKSVQYEICQASSS